MATSVAALRYAISCLKPGRKEHVQQHPQSNATDKCGSNCAPIDAGFGELPQVVAVVLAGSRSATTSDLESDFDLYLYTLRDVPVEFRRALKGESAEIDNRFWELGDEWTESSTGTHIDIMYRAPEWIEGQDRVLTSKLTTAYPWQRTLSCVKKDPGVRAHERQDPDEAKAPVKLVIRVRTKWASSPTSASNAVHSISAFAERLAELDNR